MKKDFVMPILVLTLICLIISAVLAFTNSKTEPVIVLAAQERAEEARNEIIPSATGFKKLEIDGLPSTITEVYATENDVGYVFMITTTGYGGEMQLICGIDNDGRIISCKTLKHSETKGMGSKTAEDDFRNQFVGKDSSLDGVSAISGATISSNAYLGAINDVFTAYEAVKEGM